MTDIHVRQQVRDNIATLVKQVPEFGDRVFTSRTSELGSDEIPASIIVFEKEVIANIGSRRPNIGMQKRNILTSVYIFAKSIEKYPRFKHGEFENNLGPAMRFIYDFAKPDQFLMVLTTGQSGCVLSDHYKDMTNLWLNGKYIKVRTDLASIIQNKNLLRFVKQN